MKNAPTIVSDEEETIEDTKCDGVDCEKVHRRNNFAVVLEKGFPPSDLVGVPWCSLDPARNRSLRDIKSKHLQFPVNARRTPAGVLSRHFEDQFAQLLADALASRGNRMVGEPGPVETETSTVPAWNGLCTHHDQGLFPSRPLLSRKDPEEFIERSETGPGVRALEDKELLPQRQVFKQKAPTRTEKANKRGQKESNRVKHSGVLSQVACEWQPVMLLKTEANRAVARHNV